MQSQTHHQLPGATVILKLEENASAGKCRRGQSAYRRYLLCYSIPSRLKISIKYRTNNNNYGIVWFIITVVY